MRTSVCDFSGWMLSSRIAISNSIYLIFLCNRCLQYVSLLLLLFSEAKKVPINRYADELHTYDIRFMMHNARSLGSALSIHGNISISQLFPEWIYMHFAGLSYFVHRQFAFSAVSLSVCILRLQLANMFVCWNVCMLSKRNSWWQPSNWRGKRCHISMQRI